MNPLRITGRTWPGRSVAAAVAVALAHVPVIDAAIFRELPAAALAEMRGKFVAGRQVQYFGMTVTTRWAGSAPPAASQAGDRVAVRHPVEIYAEHFTFEKIIEKSKILTLYIINL